MARTKKFQSLLFISTLLSSGFAKVHEFLVVMSLIKTSLLTARFGGKSVWNYIIRLRNPDKIVKKTIVFFSERSPQTFDKLKH